MPLISNAAYTNRFGVVFPDGMSAAQGLQHMDSAGATWASTIIDWRVIEKVEGQYDWTATDQSFAEAQAVGMQIHALFYGDPSWAWKADKSGTIPEKRLNFVRKMAERYDCDGVDDAPNHPCVSDWAFYPEPDCYRSSMAQSPGAKGFWGRRGADYADMLAAVAAIIHEESPNADVLIGGIAYDSFEKDGGPFVQDFLDTVLARLNSAHGGAAQTLDGVAFHYYPNSPRTLVEKAAAIRTIMTARGVGDLPLIVPEGGDWSDQGKDLPGDTIQALGLMQIYSYAAIAKLDFFAWYAVFDHGSGTEQHGLFWDKDLSRPKAAYYAYKTAARELDGATLLADLSDDEYEAYRFSTASGGTTTVFWPRWDKKQSLSLKASCVIRLDMAGNVVATITDGKATLDEDGKVNGSIQISTPAYNGVYLKSC